MSCLGHSLGGILPFCRDAVCVFYRLSQQRANRIIWWRHISCWRFSFTDGIQTQQHRGKSVGRKSCLFDHVSWEYLGQSMNFSADSCRWLFLLFSLVTLLYCCLYFLLFLGKFSSSHFPLFNVVQIFYLFFSYRRDSKSKEFLWYIGNNIQRKT